MTTMTSEILTVLVITAAALWLGYCLGFTSGNKRGRDLQWVEDFINAQKTNATGATMPGASSQKPNDQQTKTSRGSAHPV